MVGPGEDITGIVRQLGAEDAQTSTDAHALLCDEIRRLVKPALQGESPEHRLKTTDVVHHAFERLFLRPRADGRRPEWPDRLAFYGAAAKTIRDILVDEARRRLALKRGGGRRTIPLEAVGDPFCMPPLMAIELRGELERLSQLNERAARVVELKFFAGLSIEDIAEMMDVSASTIRRDWDMARLWLYERLNGTDGQAADPRGTDSTERNGNGA
ncbi:MAG: hypothetical protein LAT64_07960 [Phycisphaerales bacterium]|nr:RNA polymerase subunit sigma [Planctomycetota bacterium]MCH8508689.1 hypothetical protein [Phycisphaerales bacterium]